MYTKQQLSGDNSINGGKDYLHASAESLLKERRIDTQDDAMNLPDFLPAVHRCIGKLRISECTGASSLAAVAYRG